MDRIPAISYKILTQDTTFDNYLLIVDAYSKISKLYGMENITAEEVMDNIDMFQARFGKADEFFWWDMEIIQTESYMQFTFKGFQEGLSVRGVRLASSAPDH